MTETVAAAGNDLEARTRLRAAMREAGLTVHHPDDEPVFTRVPTTSMVPMQWRWQDLDRYVGELGRILDLAPGGARRTLRLANPGLPYGTTPTFWASIQHILPGEVATAHRHTPDAFRFIMRGSGCRTTVDGENYPLQEGDLVLTPNWAWHDHVHHGDEPMTWLDVLDVSLMRHLHNIFFDPYSRDVQPVARQPERSSRLYGSGLMRPSVPAPASDGNPLLVYPKAIADAALEEARALDPDPADDVMLEYQNPADGGPAMPSMSMKAQILRAGFSGVPHRHSGSKVYWVIDGAGTTFIDGQRFDWDKGDFLAVPPWALVRHANGHDGDARLFRVDDSPVYRALRVYHEVIEADVAAAGGA